MKYLWNTSIFYCANFHTVLCMYIRVRGIDCKLGKGSRWDLFYNVFSSPFLTRKILLFSDRYAVLYLHLAVVHRTMQWHSCTLQLFIAEGDRIIIEIHNATGYWGWQNATLQSRRVRLTSGWVGPVDVRLGGSGWRQVGWGGLVDRWGGWMQRLEDDLDVGLADSPGGFV